MPPSIQRDAANTSAAQPAASASASASAPMQGVTTSPLTAAFGESQEEIAHAHAHVSANGAASKERRLSMTGDEGEGTATAGAAAGAAAGSAAGAGAGAGAGAHAGSPTSSFSSSGGAPKRRRSSVRLSNRVTALVLAAETLAWACTQRLLEEAYRPPRAEASASGDERARLRAWRRALDALKHAEGLMSPSRRAGALDETRRVLGATQPERLLDAEWARPGLSLGPTRDNYKVWDPPMSDAEWADERQVLHCIRSAIAHAVQACDVHLYAPIVLVAANVASKAVTYAAQRAPAPAPDAPSPSPSPSPSADKVVDNPDS